MKKQAFLVVFFFIFLVVPVLASAEERSPVMQYTWETECRHTLPEDVGFTAQEAWAWNERLCLGKLADMSGYGGGDDLGCHPDNADKWPETRRLSEAFLRTILFHEPFKNVSPRPHTHIRCALFTEIIDLSNFSLENELWLNGSRFRKDVDLFGLSARRGIEFNNSVFDKELTIKSARAGGELSLEGSTLEGPFNAERLEVKDDVFLDKGASFKKDVSLKGAKIGGELSVEGSTVEGAVNAEGLEVKGNVFLDKGASFKAGVSLSGSRIGGELSLEGSTVEGAFNAEGLEVKDKVSLDGGASFKRDVSFSGARIGGELNAAGSTFEGPFNAEGMEVDGNVFLDGGADFHGSIILKGGSFKGDVLLDKGSFHSSVDFTGATIRGVLNLVLDSDDPGQPRWKGDAELNLRNLSANVLHESHSAWCLEGKQESCARNDSRGFVPLDLKGFTYQKLGGSRATGAGESLAARDIDWMLAWLGAQRDHGAKYNPQPYTQLAKVLNDAGNPAKANEILYNLRQHERTAANTPWPTKILLTLQWLLIGYGYANWKALIPYVFMVLGGAWACGKAEETKKLKPQHKLWYSVDRSIPYVSLGASEDVSPPTNWVATYFYFQQIICLVLATFLVAGLSGFTK